MTTFQKNQVQDIYYLSPMQEGMLFQTLLHPGQNFYFEQISTQIKGSLDIQLLEESMNAIMNRYDIFRTVFIHEKMKRPVQVVLKQRSINIQEIDLSHLTKNEQDEKIRDYEKKDKEKEFNLSKDLPIRSTVIKKGDHNYIWIWSYHHILFDGWCFGTIVNELFQIYHALFHNKTYSLPPVKPYKEYIHWLEQQDKQKSLQYWNQYLDEFEGQTTFTELRKKSTGKVFLPEEVVFTLEEGQSAAFAEMAGNLQVTLSTALQTVWAVLLSRYQRTNDIIFGTVVSGRPSEIEGVEKMVGLFINAVPNRIRFSNETTFAQCLSAVQQQSLESEAHHYIPLYDIQSKAELPDLIDHLVVFENYPIQQSGNVNQKEQLGFSIEDTNIFEKSNYDFNLIASPGKEMTFKLAFNANVFDRAFVNRVKDQLYTIIEQVCRDPEKKMRDIQVVSNKEKQHLLKNDNQVPEGVCEDETLTAQFEKIVRSNPEHVALRFNDQQLTYGELNARANQLAHELRASGFGSGSIIAILLRRSPEMIISILGILKAGAAYLPIDPDYPMQRIQYMMEDSMAVRLITQHDLILEYDAFPFENNKLLFIDEFEQLTGDRSNLHITQTAGDLAYVIYTSGTTGKPKGILTTHLNVTTVVKNTSYIQITLDDTLLSLSNYAFDGFTFDLFGALLNGAALVIAPGETILNMNKLTRLIERESISVFFTTTALFNLLVDAGGTWMDGPRKVLFGGERASVKHVQKAFQAMGPGKLINVYGPTETTVFASFYQVEEWIGENGSIPIGKPIHLTDIYILNNDHHLQPMGAAGELCISGKGVAVGYLNRPDLSKEKFIPHPFLHGQKLYRSGDLARFLPDGTIEFLGRFDDQVKIRGQRLELGEIRDQLLRFPDLKEAEVIAYSPNEEDTYLCAYIVCEDMHHSFNEQVLRRFLAQTLPGYMVPAKYIQLDNLPLTSNGKVNRRLLPLPKHEQKTVTEKTPPKNETESQLADLWAEVLNVPNMGIHDNFFDLGGHSLKAMALSALVLKTMQREVPVHIIFNFPTISEMAAYIQNPERARQVYTMFNPEAEKKLFVFPPVVGYGMMFNDLAKQLPDYRVYAFDFIEEDDRIEHYVKTLLDLQPESPFSLLGYSAGCGLAFEVAKELERKGRKVDSLIMVDSYKKIGVSDLEGRSVEQDVQALLAVNKDHPTLQDDTVRTGIASKLKAYYTYFVELINEGKVEGNIHLLRSESSKPLPDQMASWETATAGAYQVYQGLGIHEEMLFGQNAEINGKHIHQLLQEGNNNEPTDSAVKPFTVK